VALLTDGRMSGASGKVLAAIHVTPEAADGGALAKLREGDIVCIDAEAGTMDARVNTPEWDARECAALDLSGNQFGMGRELFGQMRSNAGPAEDGACALFGAS
jgi:phosphogluconate dehydratase